MKFLNDQKQLFNFKFLRKQAQSTTKLTTKKPPLHDLNDFTIEDQDQRNILHRAALDQDLELIKDIIAEYRQCLIEIGFSISDISSKISDYLNIEDKFGLNTLYLCCVQKDNDDERLKCLNYLIKKKASVTNLNKISHWTPVHWLCFHGDTKSLQLIIENDGIGFLPNSHGYLPIDLAGIYSNKETVEYIVQYLIQIYTVIDQQAIESNRIQSQVGDSKGKIYPDSFSKNKKFLNSPMLRTSLIYWCSYYSFGIKYIDDILKLKYIFLQAPHHIMNKATSIHAAAQRNNIDILKIIIEFLKDQKTKPFDIIPNEQIETKFTTNKNHALSLEVQELKIFKKHFQEHIKHFHKWIIQISNSFCQEQTDNSIMMNQEQFQIIQGKQKIDNFSLLLHQQDQHGNTPIHLAIMMCSEESAKLLLNEGADADEENKEVWAAKSLIKQEEFRNIVFGDAQIQKEIITGKILHRLNNSQKTHELETLALLKSQPISTQVDIAWRVYKFCNNTITPDLVIKCPIVQGEKSQIHINKLNLQISILLSSKFIIYLTTSLDSKFYFIMLKHKDYDQQAEDQKMLVKLIDSFDMEVFEVSKSNVFEPFRSKQKQEIVETHLNKVVKLNEQKAQNTFVDVFRMHSIGAIDKISQLWFNQEKWYLPQPLSCLRDFLHSSQKIDFTSLNILKLYFGEKMAFFFAWKSFITVYMIFLAIPGLALQIYIFKSNEFDTSLLYLWVFYVNIWSFVIVELWVRKSYEIIWRWGQLEEANEGIGSQQQVRNDFCGYENVDLGSGEIVKETSGAPWWVNMLQVPLLFIMTGACVIIFYYVQMFNDVYGNDNNYYSLLGGVMQGVGIYALNSLHSWTSPWFTQKENHKFEQNYENSLIYKNSLFKLVNSYLSIVYACFFNTNTTYQLFQLLLPVLIVKQLQYLCLQVIFPYFKYQYDKSQYFNLLKDTSTQQKDMEKIQEKDYIAKVFKAIGKTNINTHNRQVIQLQLNDQSNPIMSNVSNLDLDSVELNSLKQTFDDNISSDNYMQTIIDFGYITMFAYAFPIGAFICIFTNIFEIKIKISNLIYVYKRAVSRKAQGIGQWLLIWRIITYGGIFINILLLYFRQKDTIVSFIFKYNQHPDSIGVLLIFVLIVITLLFINLVIAILLKDIPDWVEQELLGIINSRKLKDEIIEKQQQKNLICKEQEIKQNQNPVGNANEQQKNDVEQELILQKIEMNLFQKFYTEKQLSNIEMNQKIMKWEFKGKELSIKKGISILKDLYKMKENNFIYSEFFTKQLQLYTDLNLNFEEKRILNRVYLYSLIQNLEMFKLIDILDNGNLTDKVDIFIGLVNKGNYSQNAILDIILPSFNNNEQIKQVLNNLSANNQIENLKNTLLYKNTPPVQLIKVFLQSDEMN